MSEFGTNRFIEECCSLKKCKIKMDLILMSKKNVPVQDLDCKCPIPGPGFFPMGTRIRIWAAAGEVNRINGGGEEGRTLIKELKDRIYRFLLP